MFRTAELGQKIPKKEFKEKAPLLRQDLLDVQQQLLQLKKFPVIIVFAGVNGAGKGETVNLLNEWMDPRWLITRAYDKPSTEEKERPEFWRFWRDLPPKGHVGLFLSSWYSRPLLDRVHGKIDEVEFNDLLDRVINFERALTDDGALILKFWMHLSKEAQRKRFKVLEKDPLTSWRVTQEDWDNWHIFSQFEESAERIIMRSSTGDAPWSIIEGADPNFRSLTVATIIRDEINKRLETMRKQEQAAALAKSATATSSKVSMRKTSARKPKPATGVSDNLNLTQLKQSTVLDVLDMNSTLSKEEYKQKLQQYQAKLNELHRKALKKKVSTILLFEGPDAAGKGGAIRRVVAALDARHCRVIPIAAPTDEEWANHYLWRFWRHLSRAGKITIFDRSWYGRVLVERVEGFAKESEWRRAYAEINDFEEQLTDSGIVLMKYWIHISKQEQLDRFNARKEIAHKQWKLTEEDWRNREKWEDYEYAVNDIVEHTSTRLAPWTLVEGNDKRFARIKVLESLCNNLEQALKHNVKSWNRS
jgi:AMP-polyphosphate phosphotransferase